MVLDMNIITSCDSASQDFGWHQLTEREREIQFSLIFTTSESVASEGIQHG